MESFIKLDQNEAIFFQKELEHVKSRSFDVRYPELKQRTLVPVSNEAGPGAETIAYQQFDQVGIAKIISNYADDLPRADIKAKEFRSPVRGIGSSYGYSIQEIRAAKMAGKPLQQRRANAARRSVLQEEARIAYFGDADHGLTGLLNNANVTQSVVPADGVGGSTRWADKTPEQILRDMNACTNGIVSLTRGIEIPDTLVLPLNQYSLVASRNAATGTDTTILMYFLNNNPYIKKVDWLNELQGAGVQGTDRMFVYRRDPDHLTLEIPSDYEQLPPEERGLEILVHVHQRIGGTIFYYPLSAAYCDGI